MVRGLPILFCNTSTIVCKSRRFLGGVRQSEIASGMSGAFETGNLL